MYYSKSLALIGLALAAPTATNAFAPSTTFARPTSTLSASKDPSNERVTPPDAIRNLAAVSALTLGLLFPSGDALAAQDTAQLHALHSSTVELSATIRTMDFSMPSSYDTIVDVSSTKDSAVKDELTKDTVVQTGGSKKKAAPKKEKKAAAPKKEKSSAGSKKEKKEVAAPSGLSKKEAAEAKMAERVAEREAKEAEQAALDAKAASELDANIKASRAAKIAERAAANAEKAAAAAGKQN